MGSEVDAHAPHVAAPKTKTSKRRKGTVENVERRQRLLAPCASIRTG
jgi:hypothetical protein